MPTPWRFTLTNDSQTQPVASDAYFGLLDAIVVIAEAWKVLVIACVVAAVAAFGYFQMQPTIYQSDALVSLDAVQLARFSAPDFLERTGVDAAMWSLDLTHADAMVDGATMAYDVSFRAESPEAAQSGLDAVIKAFTAETAPDATRIEMLQRSKERILKALEDLDLIGANLAARSDTTLPGSESELYARSVVLLLDQQAKREDELLEVELKLQRGSGIVLSPPSLPSSPLPRSLRAVMIASVGAAIFLVLCFAFGREVVRRAARTASGAEKLLRIRRAFSFRRS